MHHNVSSNYNLLRIVHHMYHICRVSPQCGYGHHRYHICTVYSPCGYGHVSSNYHFGRIVLHMYHIYMVSPLCGYGHVTPYYHYVRIVHNRYHICRVYPMCGYGHVSSNDYLGKLCTTGITFERFSPVWVLTWFFKLPLSENCAPQVSHLYGLCPVWIQIWFFKLPLCLKKTCTTSATFESFHNSTSVYIHSHSEYTSTANLFPFTKVFTTVWKHTGVFNVTLHKTLSQPTVH